MKHVSFSAAVSISFFFLAASLFFLQDIRFLNLIEVSQLAGILIAAYCLVLSRGSLYHPAVLFAFPWASLLILSTLDVSQYSRPISYATISLVVFTTCAGCAGMFSFYKKIHFEKTRVFSRLFNLSHTVEIAYIALVSVGTLINVAYSGYVPLFEAAAGKYSGYLEFGIPSFLGFFYSLVNSASLIFLIKYLQRKKAITAFCIFLGVFVQILFFSRQNVVFSILEISFLYFIVSGFPSPIKMFFYIVPALFLFAAAGDLRGGGIRDLIGLNQTYEDAPSAFVWLYAYSYFNILNLDNLIYTSKPTFSGEMFDLLLPSFLRGEKTDNSELLELSNFNVSSYLSSVYSDVGVFGSCLFVFVAGFIVSIFFYRSRASAFPVVNVVYASLSSVGLVCVSFSFFHNFFLFPPVFYQFFFVPLIYFLLTKRASKTND